MTVKHFNNSDDYDSQQTILGILLKIKDSDKMLTMAEAAVILSEYLDISYEEFNSKCGSIVKETIKRDAIKNRQLRGYHNSKKATVDDLFDN